MIPDSLVLSYFYGTFYAEPMQSYAEEKKKLVVNIKCCVFSFRAFRFHLILL